MPHSMRLLFFAGSARQESFNKRLAKFGAAIAHANGIAATLADLGDYPMPLYDGDIEDDKGPPENARKLQALMQAHEGIFIVAARIQRVDHPAVEKYIGLGQSRTCRG